MNISARKRSRCAIDYLFTSRLSDKYLSPCTLVTEFNLLVSDHSPFVTFFRLFVTNLINEEERPPTEGALEIRVQH